MVTAKKKANEKVNKVKAEDIKRQAARKALYPKVFGTPEGREVLYDICEIGHLHKCLPTSELEISEGMRRLALHILTVAETDPADILREATIHANMLKSKVANYKTGINDE